MWLWELKPNTVCPETLITGAVPESSLTFLVHGTSYITAFNYFVLKFEETLATQDSGIDFVPKNLVLCYGFENWDVLTIKNSPSGTRHPRRWTPENVTFCYCIPIRLHLPFLYKLAAESVSPFFPLSLLPAS